MSGVFDGVRVIDLSEGVAGPMGAALLADFGADVIKVERAEGDRCGRSPGYWAWNRGKRRVRLDPASESGRRALDTLLDSAEVVVVDRPPVVVEREGLHGAALRAGRPSLIHVWLPPYGTDARYADLPPSELLLQAMTGTAFSQFSEDDVPVNLVTPQLGYFHGVLCAIATAAALYARRRNGLGQEVVVSGFDALAYTRAGTAADPDDLRRPPARGARGSSPSYRLYPCRDGEWLFLGTLLMPHFRVALEVLDLLHLLDLEGVGGVIGRLRLPDVAPAVHAALGARFLAHDRDTWIERLAARGVPCAPVGDRDDWFRGPTIEANRMRLCFTHPEVGPVAIPGVPLELSATPGRVRGLLETVDLDALELPPRASIAAVAAEGGNDGPPLEGVRVLDLGAIIAGPLCAQMLASLGADVVKLEPIGGEGFRPSGRGFIGFNQGKRGLTLDLAREEGREVFFALLRDVDVIVDNYRSGVLDRLGIGYPELRARDARIIQASITGYGDTGPLAAEPGFDPLLQARSGLMRAQGGDGEPVFHQIPINDMASAGVLAFGILAALYDRIESGVGQRVSTSLAHQSVYFQSDELCEVSGRGPALRGGRDFAGPSALSRFYRCADGFLAIDVGTEAGFSRLCDVLGIARGSVADPVREGPEGELSRRLARAFAGASRDETVGRLSRAGVPAAPARTFQELIADPGKAGESVFLVTDHPTFGRTVSIRRYVGFRGTPSEIRRRAPLLGEHSRELLESCGLSSDRIRALYASRISSEP